MELGLVLQTDPPASRLVELARRAEEAGFTHLWTFDSHILWQEPFVIYSRILGATESIIVGPMVTNPLTRDPTVTASLFATLNDMYGNRTVCGIGRGDSAVRVRGGTPATLGTLEGAIETIRALANRRGDRTSWHVRPDPLGEGRLPRGLDGRLRPEGPRPRWTGRRRPHPAARRPLSRRMVGPPRPRGTRHVGAR